MELFSDKFRSLKQGYVDRQNYSYKHFGIQGDSVQLTATASTVIDQIERERGNSRVSFDRAALPSDVDPERLRKINDYVIKFYGDLFRIQQVWFKRHKRFFQGLPTTAIIPDYRQDAEVKYSHPTDQADDWGDVGFAEKYTPVQTECHVYQGPSGHGFTVLARFKIGGVTWINQMHHGPETHRDSENFRWRAAEPSSLDRLPKKK